MKVYIEFELPDDQKDVGDAIRAILIDLATEIADTKREKSPVYDEDWGIIGVFRIIRP